jgi:hypothetical protein
MYDHHHTSIDPARESSSKVNDYAIAIASYTPSERVQSLQYPAYVVSDELLWLVA